MHEFLANPGPEIKVVPSSTTLEALEKVTAEIRRERTAFSSLGRLLKRTLAPHLVSRPLRDDKPEKLKNFSHRYNRPQLSKVNACHDRFLTD